MNEFKINQVKTVIMFRKEGRFAENYNISFKEKWLEIVNSFKYLGPRLQLSVTSTNWDVIYVKELIKRRQE
jgi:hypothetical protein